MLGGTQSLHTNSNDETLALPTEEAVRVALRTQQVIAHETGVTNTVDPLGGSYFVEALTDQLEAQAYAYFDRIDELGGMIAAVKRGFFRREIADAAFDYQQEVDRGTHGRRRQRLHRGRRRRDRDPAIDPALERKQIDRVQAVRARRDAAVERALGELRAGCAGGQPDAEPSRLRPRTSTEGEIVESLQEVFGTYTETPVF